MGFKGLEEWLFTFFLRSILGDSQRLWRIDLLFHLPLDLGFPDLGSS